MISNDRKIKMMRDGSINKTLLRLGIPTMIGMIISALYSVVDAYFAGNLGVQQVGAISIVFPIVQIIIGLGMMFGTGAASYLSRLLGDEDRVKANKVASSALFYSIFVGLLLIIISLCFLTPLLKILGATNTILPYAKSYAIIFISGSILNIFNITMNNLVAAEGRTKLTMTSMIVGGGLNIILDPIFIFVFNMGIQGAAIATVVSQAITSLIYVNYILRNKGCLKFHYSFVEFDKSTLKEILKVGIPILIYQFLTSFSMAMMNSSASNYGDSAIAAFGVVMRLMTLGTYVVFGFMKGFQPFVGYNYGAKNYRRVNQSIKTVLIWTSCFCFLYTLIVYIFSQSIITIFSKTNDLKMINIGIKVLRVNCFSMLFFGFEQVYLSLFLALGKGKQGGLLSLARQGYFLIPLIIILPTFYDINGLIFAQPIADILTSLLTLKFSLDFYLDFVPKLSKKI
ncbi:MAG: MATE family efflux transporter [Pleomorphochaeta sp.]